MKLPDLNEFNNSWPKSLPILKERILFFFKINKIEHDNVWFPDIEIVFPESLRRFDNIQIVFFGGFLERVFESGNWPDKKYVFWCLSNPVKQVLIRLLNFPENSIRVIPRYELFQKIDKLKKIDLSSDLQIIYSGRLSAQKNIEMFLCFTSLLQERLPVKVETLMLGEWDNNIPKNRGRYIISSYQDIVEKFQKKFEFKNIPTIKSHLNSEEWLDCVGPNCLIVNFSTFVCEDFGVSLAQAQGMGLPMLISKWGGHSDLVGENVYWVNVEDIGESFTSDEKIFFKAQHLVDKFLDGHLICAIGESHLSQSSKVETISLAKLNQIRLTTLGRYGQEMQLLGQDRMSLFASSNAGKIFFKNFSSIFIGDL